MPNVSANKGHRALHADRPPPPLASHPFYIPFYIFIIFLTECADHLHRYTFKHSKMTCGDTNQDKTSPFFETANTNGIVGTPMTVNSCALLCCEQQSCYAFEFYADVGQCLLHNTCDSTSTTSSIGVIPTSSISPRKQRPLSLLWFSNIRAFCLTCIHKIYEYNL